MGIVQTATTAQIKADMARRLAIISNEVLIRLSALGEKAVNMSRESLNINPAVFPVTVNGKTGKPLKQRYRRDGKPNPVFGDYLDHTENLRSSIGYLVTHNGTTFKADFESSTAKSYAEQIAAKYANGWVLIVVAAENYALAVESKGYNVISSAEHMVENEMPSLINKVKAGIKKMR